MKKFWMILVVGSMGVLSSCGGSDDKASDDTAEETTTNVEVKSVGELTIGYYELEKIAEDFDFYQATMKALEAKGAVIQQKMAAQQNAYQNAGVALQNGLNSNTLSQLQVEGYQEKMRRAEEEVMRIQQTELAAYEQESYEANENLMNKVDNYGREFALKHDLRLFLSQARGGQVTYVDTTFNMTTEFIDFMNAEEKKIEEDINN